MRINQELSIFTFSGDIANDTLLANIIIFALRLNGAITISHSRLCPDISTLGLCKYLVVYLSRRSQQALQYKNSFLVYCSLLKVFVEKTSQEKKNAQVLTFYWFISLCAVPIQWRKKRNWRAIRSTYLASNSTAVIVREREKSSCQE